MRIIPFRGEYHTLKEGRRGLVRNLVYPVPDPEFPFLGVHFTRRVDGVVEAGPNAVLAFRREGYGKFQVSLPELAETLAWKGFRIVARKYWRTGLGEMARSFSKAAFSEALRKLVPEIRVSDLAPGGAGVRAQACDASGALLDDFLIRELPGQVHILNAPSPAATSSLAIGEAVADRVLRSCAFVARASELQADPRRKDDPVDVRFPDERRLRPEVLRLDVQEQHQHLEVHPPPREILRTTCRSSDPAPFVSSFEK